MSAEEYKKAAQIIVKAGMLPFPLTDTLFKIMHLIYTDEEVNFINLTFKRKVSQTMDELLKSSKLPKDKILELTASLAGKGAMFDQPSSSGVIVYRLLPFISVGIFEYIFMKKVEHTEREKALADLFKKLLDEVKDTVQGKYDMFMPVFQKMPPTDRTMPIKENIGSGKEIQVAVNEAVEVPQEKVLGAQSIQDLIKKFDDIAVAHCFCRNYQLLLNKPCKQDSPEECCFTFGKSARFVVEKGFGKKISKDEALDILMATEKAGLVHKAYHPGGDIARDETSLCNCCKDCCGTFLLWRNGAIPMVNATNYLAKVDVEKCKGCGTCVEKCPVDTVVLNDEKKSVIKPEWCIGCGVCAHFCPEDAISLLEGPRVVSVPPPKLK